jgi:glutamate racemase
MSLTNNPIGVFDSGVGGLSVLRAMRAQMPNEAVIYFGDQGHVPYGPRPLEQIQSFSEGITQFLLNQEAKIIVVACNTASAAALKHYMLRSWKDLARALSYCKTPVPGLCSRSRLGTWMGCPRG